MSSFNLHAATSVENTCYFSFVFFSALKVLAVKNLDLHIIKMRCLSKFLKEPLGVLRGNKVLFCGRAVEVLPSLKGTSSSYYLLIFSVQ